ncbi:hypothetical protein C9374_011012 [Naegleria lovaniensis]|uniref:Uncharacterized protein n=1 Tax=Naegleria lovaniensis TaxID=51637 RepID=A0AA88GA33_NAELO|nr:uncharacterized protein C9374_011012 [Naegleria lovaniensis]KAG2374175.1 hypothetical protein C9374_011012 [Naegleria lovaniensis]
MSSIQAAELATQQHHGGQHSSTHDCARSPTRRDHEGRMIHRSYSPTRNPLERSDNVNHIHKYPCSTPSDRSLRNHRMVDEICFYEHNHSKYDTSEIKSNPALSIEQNLNNHCKYNTRDHPHSPSNVITKPHYSSLIDNNAFTFSTHTSFPPVEHPKDGNLEITRKRRSDWLNMSSCNINTQNYPTACKHPIRLLTHDNEETLHASNSPFRTGEDCRDFIIQNGSNSSVSSQQCSPSMSSQKKSPCSADRSIALTTMTVEPLNMDQATTMSPIRIHSKTNNATTPSLPTLMNTPTLKTPTHPTISSTTTTLNEVTTGNSAGSKLWKFCSPQTPDSVRQLRIDKQRKMEKINSIRNTPIVTKCDVLTGSCVLEWKVSVVGQKEKRKGNIGGGANKHKQPQSTRTIPNEPQTPSSSPVLSSEKTPNTPQFASSSPVMNRARDSSPVRITNTSSSYKDESNLWIVHPNEDEKSPTSISNMSPTVHPALMTGSQEVMRDSKRTLCSPQLSPFELGSPFISLSTTSTALAHVPHSEVMVSSDAFVSSRKIPLHQKKQHPPHPFTIRTSISIQDLLN